jgi:hypothetical protein
MTGGSAPVLSDAILSPLVDAAVFAAGKAAAEAAELNKGDGADVVSTDLPSVDDGT